MNDNEERRLTTRNLVHFVLNEIVNQRDQCSKEQAGHDFAVLDSPTVVRAKGEAAQGPRQSGHQVRDHEDIVPIMIVGRGHVGPASTCQGSEDAHSSDQLGECRVGTRSEDVPEEDEHESWTGSDSDEDLEE